MYNYIKHTKKQDQIWGGEIKLSTKIGSVIKKTSHSMALLKGMALTRSSLLSPLFVKCFLTCAFLFQGGLWSESKQHCLSNDCTKEFHLKRTGVCRV